MSTLKQNFKTTNSTKMKKCITPREFFEKLYGQSNCKTEVNHNRDVNKIHSDVINNNIVKNRLEDYQDSMNRSKIVGQEEIPDDNQTVKRNDPIEITKHQTEVPESLDTNKEHNIETLEHKRNVSELLKVGLFDSEFNGGPKEIESEPRGNASEANSKESKENSSSDIVRAQYNDTQELSDDEMETGNNSPEPVSLISNVNIHLNDISTDDCEQVLPLSPQLAIRSNIRPKPKANQPKPNIGRTEDNQPKRNIGRPEANQPKPNIGRPEGKLGEARTSKPEPNNAQPELTPATSTPHTLGSSVFNFHHHPQYMAHVFPPGVPPGQIPIALSAFRKYLPNQPPNLFLWRRDC